MSIAPIVRSVTVKAPPERAFALYTDRIGSWWPRQHSIGPGALVDMTIDPGVGGRWFETKADGSEAAFGEVLVWDPPHRLVLAWKVDANFRFDPALETEVEIVFAPVAGGGTLVTLEHRNLERFGTDAAKIAGMLEGGYPLTLSNFADFVASQA